MDRRINLRQDMPEPFTIVFPARGSGARVRVGASTAHGTAVWCVIPSDTVAFPCVTIYSAAPQSERARYASLVGRRELLLDVGDQLIVGERHRRVSRPLSALRRCALVARRRLGLPQAPGTLECAR